MIYLVSYPRSANTACRYIIELLTRKPTNGLIGAVNARDNLQEPLIHKGRKDYVLHKRHDFRNVKSSDFVLFLIRDPLEAIIRHNEKIRGIAQHQIVAYLKSWFSLLQEYDDFEGNKMVFYYEELMKIADKTSRGIYRSPESGDDLFYHRAKLGNHLAEKMEAHIRGEYEDLYIKYLSD